MERFDLVFGAHLKQWLTAGDAFHEAAAALDSYAYTLSWAQGTAAEAIGLWNTGNHQVAIETLGWGRSQLHVAGMSTATTIAALRERAPHHQSLGSKLGHFLSDLGNEAKEVGGKLLDSLESVGNAALNHPNDLAYLGLGLVLTAASEEGIELGIGLSVTGAGAALASHLLIQSFCRSITVLRRHIYIQRCDSSNMSENGRTPGEKNEQELHPQVRIR